MRRKEIDSGTFNGTFGERFREQVETALGMREMPKRRGRRAQVGGDDPGDQLSLGL